jgi:hypothetical protein
MEDDMKGILDDMLKEIVKNKPNEYRTAFGVLVKLLNNIIENPNEPKFRGIKKSNLVVKTKLLIIPEIVDVLNILGFEEGTGEKEDFYLYEGNRFESLKECVELLNNLLSNSEPIPTGKYKVIVYQYDLTQGMARSMSAMYLGKQIEGVWHTGVCVFGREYFYGGGICVGEPKKTPYGYPVKELDFGFTNKTPEEFKQYINSINSQFTINTYDVLNHNCNHFTDAALFFLVQKHLPNSILKQHEEILNTPMGQMIRPLLESMSRGNNAFLPNAFEGRNNNNGGMGGFM